MEKAGAGHSGLPFKTATAMKSLRLVDVANAHYSRSTCCQVFQGSDNRNLKMSNDNNKPSYVLTFDDAVNVWLRHWRGEFQNRIASSYDVNPGRVNDVLKERKHIGSRKVASERLSAA
jgi:hypothetical protein